MKNLVSITELAAITGLSVKTIRRRIQAGSLPYIRANAASNYGKLLFDVSLIQQVLLNEAVASMRTSGGFVTPEPVIDFDPSFGTEEGAPITAANAHKFFAKITPEDVDKGWFGADTFALKSTGEPTSETITQKALKKP